MQRKNYSKDLDSSTMVTWFCPYKKEILLLKVIWQLQTFCNKPKYILIKVYILLAV